MRLKKLKISVAISLIIFVLIFGNIIAFGFLKNNLNISDKKPLANIIVLESNNSDKKTLVSNKTNFIENSPDINTNSQQDTSTIPRRIVIVHRSRRTRAS